MTARRARRVIVAVVAVIAAAIAAIAASMLSASAVAPDPEAQPVADGLMRYFRSLSMPGRSLRSIERLSAPVPMTEVDPLGEQTLNVQVMLGQLADELQRAASGAQAVTNLDDLANRLEGYRPATPPPAGTKFFVGCETTADPDAGCRVRRAGAGAAEGLRVPVHLEHTRAVPAKAGFGPVSVTGGTVPVVIRLDAVITLVADQSLLALPAGEREAAEPVYTPADTSPTVDLTVSIDGDTLDLGGSIGIGRLDVGGTADLTSAVHLVGQDTDGDERVTLAELTADPRSVFRATPTATGTLDLDLDSALVEGSPDAELPLSLDAATGRLVAPSDLDVRVTDLAPLTRMTMPQFLGALAQVPGALDATQTAGLVNPTIPFTNRRISDVVSFAEPVRSALVGAGVVAFPMDGQGGSTLAVDASPENLARIPTADDALDAVARALLPGDATLADLGARLDGDQLLFDMNGSRTPEPMTLDAKHVDLTVFERIGLGSFAPAMGQTSPVTVTSRPSVRTELPLGVDLSRSEGTPATHIYVRTGDGSNVTADFPTDVDINAQATVGYLDVVVRGAPRLRPSDDHMVQFGFKSDDGRLTVAELLASVLDDPASVIGEPASIVSAEISPTDITVEVDPVLRDAGAIDVTEAVVTLGWRDITRVEGDDGPQLSFAEAFRDGFLPFAFDPDDPAALFGDLHGVVERFSAELGRQLDDARALRQEIPLLGRSVGSLMREVDLVRGRAEALLDAAPPTLKSFIDEFEEAFGGELGVDLPTNSPVGPRFRWHRELSGESGDLPLDLALGEDGAGISTSGRLDLGYELDADINFGVDLPSVAPGTAEAPPTASGAVVPYLLDTTNISLGVEARLNGTADADLFAIEVDLGRDGDPVTARVASSVDLDAPDFGGDGDRVRLGDIPRFVAATTENLSLRPRAQQGDLGPGERGGCPNPGDDGCARVPVFLGSDPEPLGVLEFRFADLDSLAFSSPDGLEDLIANLRSRAPDIAWATLREGISRLKDSLESVIARGGTASDIPFLGSALDAGAEIAQTFDQRILTPVESAVSDLNAATSAEQIRTALEGIGGEGTVVLECAPDSDAPRRECNEYENPPAASEVQNAEVSVSLGESASPTLAFDLGLPGFRLKTDSGVTLGLNWTLDVTFGLDGQRGFYVRTTPTEGGDAPARPTQLQVGATVDVGDFSGQLAFIPFRATDASAADEGRFDATVALQSPSGRLYASAFGGDVDLGDTFALSIDRDSGISVGLGLEVGVEEGVAVLPTLRADFGVVWDAANPDGLAVTFDNVKIDVGSFMQRFLGPVVKGVADVVEPVRPALDVLTAPIPVVSHLAELAGLPQVTLLSLADGPTELVRTVAEVARMAELWASDAGAGAGEVEIGGFSLRVDEARYSGTSGEADRLVTGAPAPGAYAALRDRAGSALTRADDVAGFSFPAFEDPGQLFGYVLGSDPTLVRWSPGRLRAELRYRESFPIPAPLPLSIGVTVSGGVDGRFAVGLDTAGIRKVRDSGVASSFVDLILAGLYVDDREGTTDPDELRLRLAVTADFGLDTGIVSAKVEGGLEGQLGFNLVNERNGVPVPEGKLRFADLGSLVNRPACMFDISGRIDGVLRVALEVNLFFDTIRWAKTLARFRGPSIDNLRPENCDSRPPVLAVPNGSTLVLNTGDAANRYGGEPVGEDDHIVLRQLADGRVTVTGLGEVQAFPDIERVVAYGGGGNDTIVALGAENSDGDGKPFGLPLVICGGPGNDVIGGGAADDRLNGDGALDSTGDCFDGQQAGDGNDTVTGSAGDDHIWGGQYDDTLDAGPGADTVDGGYGNDDITGGPEFDTLSGGGGDDTVSAGPEPRYDGVSPDARNVIDGGDGHDPLLEGSPNVDEIRGGWGDDNLSGFEGDDFLYGEGDDDVIAGGPGVDTIDGGENNDRAFGGDGRDQISGGPGDDTELRGGTGSDTIHGNEGVDILWGEDDDTGPGQRGDQLYGDSDPDALIGDSGNAGAMFRITRTPQPPLRFCVGEKGGATGECTWVEFPQPDRVELVLSPDFGPESTGGDDDLFGADGGDYLFAGGGQDVLRGEADGDHMHGHNGDDDLYGADGADELYGGSGIDDVFGEGDGDVMLAGDEGPDTITGADGNDTLAGGLDDDVLSGDDGADSMRGDGGHDDIVGGLGAAGARDELFGGGGDDVLLGDGGTITDRAAPIATARDRRVRSLPPNLHRKRAWMSSATACSVRPATTCCFRRKAMTARTEDSASTAPSGSAATTASSAAQERTT